MHARSVSSARYALFAFVILASLVALTVSPASAQTAPAWQPGVVYAAGTLVPAGGQTYSCLQGHTSQAGWEPPTTPALWTAQSATATPTSTVTTRPTATATTRPTSTATTRPTATFTSTSTATATSTSTPTATTR